MLQQIKPNVINTHHKRAANDDYNWKILTEKEQELLEFTIQCVINGIIKNREHIA